MAARKWTAEQRAAQSAAIQAWKPWQHSAGAITATGKATVSCNAYRGGSRPLSRFIGWHYSAIEHPETLTIEIVEAAKHKSVALLIGHYGYLAASLTKFITKYEHRFSESEITELQRLAKNHEDFTNSLTQ